MGPGVQVLCVVVFVVYPITGQEGRGLPILYPAYILNGSEQQACRSIDQQHRIITQVGEEVRDKISIAISRLCTGQSQDFPATSCSEIYQLNPQCPSGFYWIRYGRGAAVYLYCDMGMHCSGANGWTRIAYLNMTNSSYSCPGGWQEITSPIRTCGRKNQAGPLGSGCSPATFTTYGLSHRYVRGRVIGYQYGTPNAFDYFYNHQSDATIDGLYLDGVSVTSGMRPREHVWSFSGAYSERYTGPYPWVCSCTNTAASSLNIPIPSWVGTDYFCESGTSTLPGDPGPKVFYSGNPLWDGQGCGDTSTCCGFRSPPWFCKQLRATTTADIEIRICADYYLSNEDTPLQLIEIYIQ